MEALCTNEVCTSDRNSIVVFDPTVTCMRRAGAAYLVQSATDLDAAADAHKPPNLYSDTNR